MAFTLFAVNYHQPVEELTACLPFPRVYKMGAHVVSQQLVSLPAPRTVPSCGHSMRNVQRAVPGEIHTECYTPPRCPLPQARILRKSATTAWLISGNAVLESI